MELALEAGADDVDAVDESFEITCVPEAYDSLAKALETAKIETESSSLGLVPKDTADVSDVETARKVIKLMEMLDDHEDIQRVSSNFSIPDAIMEQLDS